MGNIAPWSSLLKESFDGSSGINGAKVYVRRGRELLLERHRSGARGHELVSAYSDMMDCLLRHLFEGASSDYIQRYPSLDRRCALIAQGGYGRKELNPHSDIDLLFLHVWKVTPYVESVAEKILYTLWDTGLQVGHAIRSMVETVRLSNKDPIVKTALVDARYLCGDREIFDEFQKGLQEDFLRGNRDRFVRRKVEEFRSRHDRYG
ncbi:MAG: DUF294 nucleotidyltransferase-like domain-containing protein, partial [Candidatus Binatia bacterium]|nr:DUF294 nucleotidyltransferase-like domain-containing protein [Candidatus Binatia bacterium]